MRQFLLITTALCCTTATFAKNEQPNVIMILVDDVGYSDFGCFGSEIDTPNIDALASNGVRLRNFYNQARSGPTRASLITGLYPHQVGYGALSKVEGYDNYLGHLNESNHLISEVMQSAGYFTAVVGKWHLGIYDGVSPVTRGFDRSFISPVGETYFPIGNIEKQPDRPKVCFFRDGEQIPVNDSSLPSDWYSTQLFTDIGLGYIDEAIDQDKPFFWYMPYIGAHWALQAPAETIAKYKGRYMDGFEVVRNRRFEKQIQLGLFDESVELTPRNPQAPDWDKLSQAERERYDTMMAVYAAVIEELDRGIGRIVEHLRQRGELDNTLIMLCSDNGGNGEGGVRGVMEGDNPGGPGSKIWLGASWADVANTPYFMYKHHGHEGGCNTSFIMSYPDGVDSDVCGTIQKEGYGHLIDLMPTILDVAGAKYPKTNRLGNGVHPMEGVSLLPILKGKAVGADRPIIVEHEGNKMLRWGDWKIVQEYKEPKWSLHNLREDPTEMRDLSEVNSRKLNSMLNKYNKLADHIGVEDSIEFKVGKWYSPVSDYLK